MFFLKNTHVFIFSHTCFIFSFFFYTCFMVSFFVHCFPRKIAVVRGDYKWNERSLTAPTPTSTFPSHVLLCEFQQGDVAVLPKGLQETQHAGLQGTILSSSSWPIKIWTPLNLKINMDPQLKIPPDSSKRRGKIPWKIAQTPLSDTKTIEILTCCHIWKA